MKTYTNHQNKKAREPRWSILQYPQIQGTKQVQV
jgi:hypothetical protein